MKYSKGCFDNIDRYLLLLKQCVKFHTIEIVFMTLIIIYESEIREINTSLAIQCMEACIRGCYKTINTDFKRNNTPFVLSIRQRSSEGRIFLFGFDPREFSAIMAEAPAPGVQFPQPLVNPPQAPQAPQVPQAPQAVNPPAQAADQMAPALQHVQVNAADAQNELEVNFGISFFVLTGFSGCFRYFGHML